MPAPLDLTGQRFGQLLVLARAGRVKFGREQAAWRCRCDCGREEVLAQDLLTRRDWRSCSLCRRPKCVICERTIPIDRGQANTCSDNCALTKRRKADLEHYHRKAAQDPGFNRRRHAERLQKLQADPERWKAYKQAERAKAREKWASLKTDLEQYLAEKNKRQAWYHEHAEAVQAKRRARLDALNADQLERWLERTRRYGRAYRARWREELRQDPERHQAYKDLMREYRRRQALASLLSLGHELNRRNRDVTDTDD